MKGVLLALSTVIVWAILNVVNRFCVLQYDVNIMVFTSFMIFATGVTLMIIRKQVMPQNWKSGVKYSWLYTIMQIIRSFTMISTFLYITSTETSLLFNIEIIITYILAYAIFRRIPYKGDFLGILIILLGFILLSPSWCCCRRQPVASARSSWRKPPSGIRIPASGKNAVFQDIRCFTEACP